MINKVAVLGAGYMGSAITFPLSDNGIDVNLLGTWLDDELIQSSLNGFHPRLKKPLNENVNLFYSRDLKKAIEDVYTFFIAVTSEGFADIFKLLADNLEKDKKYFFFKLTKGLVEYEGNIMRATEAASIIYGKTFTCPDNSSRNNIKITSVGGPVRAVDLSCRTPSATVYGISDKTIEGMLPCFSTDYYRIFPTNDLQGVEICSTFKNIYSIAAGICDGLYKEWMEGSYYNILAFLFNQALLEIIKIVEAAGGKKETAIGLAGAGDLHVTSAAGRNRRFGELIGKGMDPEHAFMKMAKEGEYGEGFMALKLALPWLKKFDFDFKKELPLLFALDAIVFKCADAKEELKKTVLKLGI